MTDHETCWHAVTACDASFDGRFVYAVKTTGIFCRPSCKSKTPGRDNVAFFPTAQEAGDAGFRPCKRCRPDLFLYRPLAEIAERMKTSIDNHFAERDALAQELQTLGVTQHRMTEIFRAQYHVTPGAYADALRMRTARALLCGDTPILDVALHIGFESLSAFYGFFRKHAQMSPGEYRKWHTMSESHIHQAYCAYETALGKIGIASDGGAVTGLRFEALSPWHGGRMADAVTDEAARQLEAYFAGKRKQFDLPLNPTGTAFQQAVWRGLQTIPYGETRSYRQVAQLVGNAGASRAVGMANNKNPILIVIPCHRVIGSDGALVGYAGGLEVKKKLLALESRLGEY